MTDLSKEADTLGYSALIPYSSQRIYLHNQRIGLVEQTNTTIPLSYVYWYMRSYEYHMGIVGSASGSTVKHTSPGRILEQLIPIPNEEDLECNITVLDNINASISRNNTENIQLQMLRDTLLPKLMSGELDVSNIDI
jgi:type I restriction enzyme S subunit